MIDYINLRMVAMTVNTGAESAPLPARWDDAFRPDGIGRSRWYEDVVKEIL